MIEIFAGFNQEKQILNVSDIPVNTKSIYTSISREFRTRSNRLLNFYEKAFIQERFSTNFFSEALEFSKCFINKWNDIVKKKNLAQH